ncbi:cytosine-5--methyltransferase [Laetiporus sulphureus 93-53]|uniref:Cytosine-5--methyltransferase n=1 Tax=Laetiporus sulphureus 93-53 TaxID=1314785 RepID=A0A165EMY9_9APHY|nr:cytosine-5--methyltransferase [Laetiporus sulphureus 93-53]KZT07398.1 cytosine-5--methyltransferase [Laetiporus sulphureus 93-53]
MPRRKKAAPHHPPNAKGKTATSATDERKEDTYRTDAVHREQMHNERFEKYYKAQHILPDEEWEAFMEAMRNPLPTTFRVAGSRQTAQLLNDTIKDTYVPHLAGVVFEGEAVSPPSQIPWYPEGLAWQFNVSKKVLRKSPEFKKFHSFLVFETEVGNISRQEAVSMLPPLFLQVEPHHRVMDMCAAPGSKTAQLLEALHAQDTVTASSFPTGLLIANDSDYKRTHMLIHQAARLPSPALMVTNHDASIYPIIKIPSEQVVFPSSTKARVAAKKQYQLLFDRILCDVPCSGDGTLRKNPGIWKNWQPMDGNGLHGLQIRILQRAMRMLKKGGRIVYSTCSLNPVENEAVIAAALKSIPGFQLIDMSSHLPGLVHRPGLTTWTPTVDRAITTEFATYDAYIQSLPEDKRSESKMFETHWSPPAGEVERLNLTRCLRIYPHLQDTGGFFIAILEKVPPTAIASREPQKETTMLITERREGKRPADVVDAPGISPEKRQKLDDQEALPATAIEDGAKQAEEIDEDVLEEMAEEPSSTVEAETKTEPASQVTPAEFKEKQSRKGKGEVTAGAAVHFKENPFTFISPDDPILKSCFSQLHFTPDFPSSNVLVRNPEGEALRSMYMTNDIVKDIVLHNDYSRMRLMTCGTKIIAKQESAEAKREGARPQFRVLSEGLPVVLPHIEPQSILSADVATLKVFMESYYPLCTSFGEPFKSLIESKDVGSHVVRFEPGQAGGATLTHELVLPIWKSNISVTLMLEKRAKSALSLRTFGKDVTTAAREMAQRRKKEASPVTDNLELKRESDASADVKMEGIV